MPEKITRIFYDCELCGNEYNNRESAKACEKKGLFLPKFFEFDVVKVKRSNEKTQIGVVVEDYYEDSSTKAAHREADGYAVIFKRGETVGLHDPGSLHALRFEEGACPLCKSDKVSLTTQDHWAPSNKWAIPDLKNIELTKCGSCGIRFFNRSQAQKARKRIRESLNVPIAKEPCC